MTLFEACNFSWSVWAQNWDLIMSKRLMEDEQWRMGIGKRNTQQTDGQLRERRVHMEGWKFCIIRATCVREFVEIRAFVARARFEIEYLTNLINMWLPWLHLQVGLRFVLTCFQGLNWVTLQETFSWWPLATERPEKSSKCILLSVPQV